MCKGEARDREAGTRAHVVGPLSFPNTNVTSLGTKQEHLRSRRKERITRLHRSRAASQNSNRIREAPTHDNILRWTLRSACSWCRHASTQFCRPGLSQSRSFHSHLFQRDKRLKSHAIRIESSRVDEEVERILSRMRRGLATIITLRLLLLVSESRASVVNPSSSLIGTCPSRWFVNSRMMKERN